MRRSVNALKSASLRCSDACASAIAGAGGDPAVGCGCAWATADAVMKRALSPTTMVRGIKTSLISPKDDSTQAPRGYDSPGDNLWTAPDWRARLLMRPPCLARVLKPQRQGRATAIAKRYCRAED